MSCGGWVGMHTQGLVGFLLLLLLLLLLFLPAVKDKMAGSSMATMVKSFLTKQVDWGPEVSETAPLLEAWLLLAFLPGRW